MPTPILMSLALLQAAASAPSMQPPASNVSVSPAASVSATASADTATPDPMICRRMMDSTSPFSKKVCHTASAWKRIQNNSY